MGFADIFYEGMDLRQLEDEGTAQDTHAVEGKFEIDVDMGEYEKNTDAYKSVLHKAVVTVAANVEEDDVTITITKKTDSTALEVGIAIAVADAATMESLASTLKEKTVAGFQEAVTKEADANDKVTKI